MKNSFIDKLKEFKDQNNNTLYDISLERKTLVVFLRHSGCIFCRETLNDLSKMFKQGQLEGYNVVLVHMSHDLDAMRLFNKYDLGTVSRISDRDQVLYRAFGLKKGSIVQLFGPKNWIRGISSILAGNFQGKVVGDGFQMPGIFILYNGKVVKSFVHKSASDRPDYNELTRCEI